jgi:hypothetical protein
VYHDSILPTPVTTGEVEINCLAGNQQRLKRRIRLGIHGESLTDVVNERETSSASRKKLPEPASRATKGRGKEREHQA